MKVIVTGGAGFIGSHLVDRLVKDDHHEVVIIDSCLEDKEYYINPTAKIFKLDITDPKVEEIFADFKPEAVCHLAAQINVTASVEDPVADAQTNILGSVQLLEWSRKYLVKNFIFASSGGAIYGENKKIPTPEQMNLHPISPYGVAKQAFEDYLRAEHERFGLQFTALRFSNVYGPRQQPAGEAGVIAVFHDKLLKGETAVIYGLGNSTRDYLYVKDAVGAFVRALKKPFNQVINISTGRETSVVELWELLSEIHGAERKPEFTEPRVGEITRSCLDSTQAQEKFGWCPKVSLEAGLKKTHQWFLKEYASGND